MAQQLLLLVVGFALTSVLGGVLGYMLQRRAWAHQHDVQRRDEERQQALKTFEEVSLLLDRRLYRMRRLYWAVRDRAAGAADEQELASARAGYREVLADWNDNLNRTLALVETYFGRQIREILADQIYEGFAALGRGLEEIVRMVSAGRGEHVEVPRFGYRVTRLSNRVYALNVRMLRLLEDDSIGRSAPRGPAAAAANPAGNPVLEIGDRGGAVRRLQRALRRGGQEVGVDGYFRQETWQAVRSVQRAHGLSVDGIVGADTWAALPSGAPMPLLRPGSKGEVVAGLQRVLAQQVQDRGKVSPETVTGMFDASTSVAVQAFQRHCGIPADGLVGDQTWAAAVGDSGSLEVAVGLEHVAGDRNR